MVDPDSAAPATGIIGEQQPANAGARTASGVLLAADDKAAASADGGDRDDHEAPRRVPTMWR